MSCPTVSAGSRRSSSFGRLVAAESVGEHEQGKEITVPLARNVASVPSSVVAPSSIEAVCPAASFICEAIVRLKIRS